MRLPSIHTGMANEKLLLHLPDAFRSPLYLSMSPLFKDRGPRHKSTAPSSPISIRPISVIHHTFVLTSGPMAGTSHGWLKNLSSRRCHAVSYLVDTWRARRVERITAGEPPSSPKEESSDKVDMEDAEEEEQAPTPTAGFTLQQTEAKLNDVMAKVQV